MKIVININNSTYETIKHEYCTDPTQKGLLKVLRDAIKDGTPLPKGHGRLIDGDNIKTAFPSGEYVRTESVRATIDHEDTIIEADKEESEVFL